MFSPGAVLRNRYRIQAPIGRGGMGSVYLAEDMRLEGRRCAVKAVHFDAALQPELVAEMQRQFSREASVLARLDHPNLPKVSDYFSEGGWDFLVMDFVSGQNLKEIMDEARRAGRFLSEFEVLGWARQLCDALEYMHSGYQAEQHQTRPQRPDQTRRLRPGQTHLRRRHANRHHSAGPRHRRLHPSRTIRRRRFPHRRAI
jgi:hypothetical protein